MKTEPQGSGHIPTFRRTSTAAKTTTTMTTDTISTKSETGEYTDSKELTGVSRNAKPQSVNLEKTDSTSSVDNVCELESHNVRNKLKLSPEELLDKKMTPVISL